MDFNMFQSTPTLNNNNNSDEENKAANEALNERLLGANNGDIEEQVILDEALNQASVTQGVKQPVRFRDAWAALLFIAHLAAITYVSFKYGTLKVQVDKPANQNGTIEVETIRFRGLIMIMLLSAMACSIVSAGALTVMTHWATQLVQVSLLFSVFCDVLLVLFLALQQYWYGAGIACLVTLLAIWYCSVVWYRVPFAAANLQTAITSLKSNGGIWLLAYFINAVLVVWTFVWIVAAVGLYTREAHCQDGVCENHLNGWLVFALLLSFYWTTQVLKNVLHATIAGVVGTWWFCPDEACTFWSPALSDSAWRASTYSLGSIAFGSLLTAVLQVLYQFIRELRSQNRGQALLVCVLECILSVLEQVVTYVNKWAYVYIGLFGYEYFQAGKQVMSLFRQRGWTTILNDDLVTRVLSLVTLVLGLLTGCFGLWLNSVKPGWLDEFGSAATIIAFGLPCIIGLALASILTSVVASGVDTVVVCFAEAPMEFERNHPGLYTAMVSAWRQVYPDEFGI